ncbi:ribosomal protein L1 [Fomitiporia mediterranea MF3/22]|uniref:ribosomal protein L1 n=1 Tax=Fomitiporia mediterranea (strain MF3/22) TaxID=694068 RepID=UPI000440836B|nr:ribosomal protein L1 [Fomitiporia mediterranea MF3/22]EJD03727.1 ribosomal protein L1 [Fomitiporia mediterranea MF3/22]
MPGASALARHFTSSRPTYLRKDKPRPAPTKAKLAARERKKALKSRKNIYENEKMPLADAVNILRAVEVARPNSTFELVVKTAMKRGSAIPKGRINLPREVKARTRDRVFVFAEGRQADEAKRAGADFVGGTELVEGVRVSYHIGYSVANGRYPATLFLCTPSLIRAITPKLGRVLGPRGLMPSERRGTVTEDVVGYLRRISGSSEWRGDKAGTIRGAIAKMDFPIEDVVRNARHFLSVVKASTGNTVDAATRQSKAGPKPVNAITRVVLSSTQGPGIQISDA